MAGRKQKGSGNKSSHKAMDRVAYSEFGAQPSSALERPIQDVPPHQQTVKVQVSRKGRKGKTVTVISGLQHPPQGLTTLAKALKAQCGSGGTVKEGTIEIQGDHAQQLVELLTQKGYKAKRSGG